MFGGDAETQLFGDGGGGNGGSDGTPLVLPVLCDTSPTPMLLIDSPLPATVENPPTISTDCVSYNIVATTPVGNKMANNGIGNGFLNPGNNTPPLNYKRHFKSSGNILLLLFLLSLFI